MNGQIYEREIEYERREGGRQVRTTLLLGVIAFGIALAVILGEKMSDPVASVVTGMIAGVAASIPTSFVLVALMRTRRGSMSEPAAAMPAGLPRMPRAQAVYNPGRENGMMVPQAQVPVIVVTPGNAYGHQGQYAAGAVYPNPMPVLTPVRREFQVIGEPGYTVDGGGQR